MKKYILLACSLLFTSLVAQAQIKADADYLIKYDVQIRMDSTNRDDVSYEVHRLYTNTQQSYYISEGLFLRDSIMQEFRSMRGRGGMRAMGMGSRNAMNFETKMEAKVFKDIANQKTLVSYFVAMEEHQYEETEIPLLWEFSDETKEIEEYVVHKATTSFAGRDYEAWFTLEIPIVDGPYIFQGLPGLIVELYDTEEDYVFQLASLTSLKEVFTFDSDARKPKLQKKEVVKDNYRKATQNSIAMMRQFMPSNLTTRRQDGRQVNLKDMERQMKEREAKRNNHIEFW